MAKLTHDGIRNLFTEVGCIMEDTSLIALVWSADEQMDISERYQMISDTHAKIGELLSIIGSAS